ncbi:MAG: hypothetical protein ACNYWU_10095 [Desulfobacterales bacterium]
MIKKKMIQSILAIFAVVFVLDGCGSMRVATTLKTDPGMREQQVADGVKLFIGQFNARQDRKKTSDKLMFGSIDIAPVTAVNAPVLQEHATDVYPRLFGNDFADLPVSLDVDCKCSNYEWGEWFQVITYGTVPLFPAWINIDCKVHTWVWGEDGCVVNETDSFTQKFSWWRTFYTPLGILPVPGFSNLRATSYGGFLSLNDTYRVGSKKLAMDSLTEAVARSIRQTNPAKLKEASESRKTRIRQIDINGQTFWSFLGFGFSKGKDQPDMASLFLYREYPTWGAKLVEQVVVARLKDGRWRPATSYLRSIKELTAAGVLLVDGKPSKVVIKKVAEPPLEDFIELRNNLTIDNIRWSNLILVEVKNRTLPRLMRERNPEYLINLVTRIEKAVLNLNEQAQMADSRVQEMVVEGKGADTTQANELSVLCRQRIAIFKPILSALKQAVAAKGR